MIDWAVETGDPEHGLIITDGFGTIASVGPCGTPDAEDVRNAHLLAAAPDLLKALNVIANDPTIFAWLTENDPKALAQAQAAIARAA